MFFNFKANFLIFLIFFHHFQGKNGSNIQEIRNCSGAKLQIESTEEDFAKIIIKGKPQSIETAKVI